MIETVKFSVPGRPLPQGSKVIQQRGKYPHLVDASDLKTKTRPSGALKKWRARVRAKAAGVYNGQPWLGDVACSAVFVFPRPRSHFTSRGALRKSAPRSPGKPDLDKLVRAILDACAGVIYRDDARVTEFRPPFCKRWARPGGVGGVYLEFDLLSPDPLSPPLADPLFLEPRGSNSAALVDSLGVGTPAPEAPSISSPPVVLPAIAAGGHAFSGEELPL